jgi:hypothetical protein
MSHKIKHFQWTDSDVFIQKDISWFLGVKKRYYSHIDESKLNLYHLIHEKHSWIIHKIRLNSKKKDLLINGVEINSIYYDVLDLGKIIFDEDSWLLTTHPSYIDQIDLSMWDIEEYRFKRSIAERIRKDHEKTHDCATKYKNTSQRY